MLYQPNILDKIASFIYSFFTLPFIKDKNITFSEHYNDQLIYTTIKKSYKDLHIMGKGDPENKENHQQTQTLVTNKIDQLSNHGQTNLKNIVSETTKPIFILLIAHAGHADVILKIYPNINDTDIDNANQAFGVHNEVIIKKTTEGVLEVLNPNSGRQIDSATSKDFRLTQETVDSYTTYSEVDLTTTNHDRKDEPDRTVQPQDDPRHSL